MILNNILRQNPENPYENIYIELIVVFINFHS